MSNIDTGLATVAIIFAILILYSIILNARATHWRIAIATFLAWISELFVCLLMAIGLFAAICGVVWAIGFFINIIWSIFA